MRTKRIYVQYLNVGDLFKTPDYDTVFVLDGFNQNLDMIVACEKDNPQCRSFFGRGFLVHKIEEL